MGYFSKLTFSAGQVHVVFPHTKKKTVLGWGKKSTFLRMMWQTFSAKMQIGCGRLRHQQPGKKNMQKCKMMQVADSPPVIWTSAKQN
jgi:hypothetical protein